MRILSAVVLSAAFLASAHMTETQDVNSPAAHAVAGNNDIDSATDEHTLHSAKFHHDIQAAQRCPEGLTQCLQDCNRFDPTSHQDGETACSAPQSEGAATKGTAGPDARPDSPSLRDMSGATRRRATARAIMRGAVRRVLKE
uniref:Uncharacterized protein n=1 Tax=Psilocybe cubensis TaxID=181762 RepID=A0A8H8CIL6_PSICU